MKSDNNTQQLDRPAAEPAEDVIALPVRYEEQSHDLLTPDGEWLARMMHGRKKRANEVGQHIANALNERAALAAEIERLQSLVNKSDGLAKEINILTKENRTLAAEVQELKKAMRELVEAAEAVIAIVDRKTVELDDLKAAIAKTKER